jgi:alkaline phosphatase D
MIDDDKAKPDADQIRFIVHLGDFIYESNGEGYHAPLNENLEPIQIMNADGTPRAVGQFPSGGGELPLGRYAKDISDYRFLYRSFLSDPDLRAARARWPFVQTWDDHEFSNDCWQSQANYRDDSGLNEGQQPRKVAANQAWFEYIPALLTGLDDSVPGVEQQAKDFAPVTVAEAEFIAPNADNFVPEDNNVKAVGSMTIYRSLRWGKHVDLVITDQRSYRSDHAFPEELKTQGGPFIFDTRNALPKYIVDIMDAGNTLADAPDVIVGQANVGDVPNARKNSPPGTMLGKAQREWFQATLKASTATWKIWGNEVPLFQAKVQDPLGGERVMSADAWDGYPYERRQLMTFVNAEGIKNLLVITGDIHAQFASTIPVDFGVPGSPVVAAELVTAGVASNSLFSFYQQAAVALNQDLLTRIITFDNSAGGGPRFEENLNMLLIWGKDAADKMATSKNLQMAFDERADVNPNLKYADTNAQGYGLLSITATQAVGKLVTVNRPISNAGQASGIKRTATFTIPKDNPGGMTGPEITGTKPFPLT